MQETKFPQFHCTMHSGPGVQGGAGGKESGERGEERKGEGEGTKGEAGGRKGVDGGEQDPLYPFIVTRLRFCQA